VIYISGKISDISRERELLNMTLFNIVEEKLKEQGYEVFNPASLEVDGGTWEYYLSRDLLWIVNNRPDLYLLANWQESKGARLEVAMAELLGLKILNK
jgi:hypothetical protein